MRVLLPEPGPLPEGGLVELYDVPAEPMVRAGFVAGVDGSVAVDGTSTGLHTDSDKEVFRALRRITDAVLVGAGTARAEDYRPVPLSAEARAWRAAHDRAPTVPLVVVSRNLDLDPQARLFTGGTTVVVTCQASPTDRRTALAEVAEVLVCGDDRVDLRAAVSAVQARGLPRLLCEGGPSLLRDLLEADLVDELCLTTSPVVAGGPGLLPSRPLTAARDLSLLSLVDGGDGTLLARWRVAT